MSKGCLGFLTNAALREAAGKSNTTARADATAFCGYLAAHGFEVDSMHLYRAVAAVAVAGVMSREPRLSHWGYHAGRPQRLADGTRETPYQQHARFLAEREYLISDDSLDQSLLALGLVQRIPATRTIRSGSGSYRLKHIAENSTCALPCGTRLAPRYVANGALIVAAVHAGFGYKTHFDELGYESVNVTFNMKKAAIDDLDCEMRPNGAYAQDRRRMADWQGRQSRSSSTLVRIGG